MRRTGPLLIVGAAVTGAVIAWLVQVALTTGGTASFVPDTTFWVVLLVIAGGVLVFGWPVRRSVHGKQRVRTAIDPFYAMRVLALAKASSLTGALLAGGAAALTVWSVSRPDLPIAPSFWPDVITLGAAIALTVAGLVVESWCRIPPGDRAELPAPRGAAEHR